MKTALRIISLFILTPIWLLIALPAFLVLAIHKVTEWLFRVASCILILAINDWDSKKVMSLWGITERRRNEQA